MKRSIRSSLIATVASALLAGGAMQVHAQNEQASPSPTLAIPLLEALEIAQTEVSGELQGAELETRKGKSVWEVEILDENGREVELAIDASDGTVLSRKFDD